MRKETIMKGLILGIEKTGGEVVKIDKNSIYLIIKKNSELDSHRARVRTQRLFKDMYGLKIKYKVI